jgi:hypothetical protein
MGFHTIQFTWNITVKEPHKITVTRIAHIWTDTLEVALDGKTVASRTVNTLSMWGFFRGNQELSIDDRLMEIWWKFDGHKADPESIVLIDENKIIAQYGSRSAARSITVSEAIRPGNKIDLITAKHAYSVNLNPFQSDSNYLDWSSTRKWFYRTRIQFGSPALPPISIKTDCEIALDALGESIGFKHEALIRRLDVHCQRLRTWRQRVSIINNLIAVPIGMVLGVLVAGLMLYIESTNFFIILLPAYFLGMSLTSISLKLAYRLASRGEAEMLSVTTILYILAELKEEDALIHPDKKQVLLARMSYLARQTLRLARRYQNKSTNINNQKWVERHFNSMEAYLRERERWVYAPIASTLQDLRNDLHQLAPIYITGLYGGFTYQPSPDVVEPKEQSNRFTGFSTWLPALLPKLLLFGFGVVLPIIMLSRLPAELAEGQQKLAGFDLPVVRSLLISLAIGCLGRVFNIEIADLFTNTDEPAQA